MGIDNNTMSFSGAVDHQSMTFSELFDKWHADRSKTVSERTSKIYRSYIDKYLPDSFKEEAVNRIYHDEWSKMKDEMLAGKAPNGVTVPSTTARHAISVYPVFIYGRRTFGLNTPRGGRADKLRHHVLRHGVHPRRDQKNDRVGEAI